MNYVLYEILDTFKKIVKEPRGSKIIDDQLKYLERIIYKQIDEQKYEGN